MSQKFSTMGEALVRRPLKREKRVGVDHFAPGQHAMFVEQGIAYLTFVDGMGHAVSVPFECKNDQWQPVGVYQRAGQATAEPISVLPGDYEPPAWMLEKLEAFGD